MQHHIKVKQYLETICSQIRCKKIHVDIREEIENHIVDQKEAFKAQGFNDETATLKALEQMGDPVIIGTELDRTHRPKPEWSVITLTILLLAAGTVIRFFTSPQDFNGIELFNKQLFFTIVGIVLMALFYYMDFTILGKYPKTIFLLLAAVTIFLIIVSNPINGKYVYASYLLLLFPISFAGFVYNMRNRGYIGVVFCGIFFAVSFMISMIIPSVSSCILLVLSCLAVLTIAILKGWFSIKKLYALLLVYLPVIGSLTMIFASGILSKRITLALNPSIDPSGAGYIGTMTRRLLSGAQFIGQGNLPQNFQGLSAAQVLPGINSDFLLTYIIHRFGWLTFVIVLTLLTVFIVRAIILCLKQKSVLALLVSTAVTLTFIIQTILYIAANLGFQLFAPLSLPLVSQGSSYLLINMCLIGILLSVFRTGYFIKDKQTSIKASTNSFLKFEDGKLIIDFNIH